MEKILITGHTLTLEELAAVCRDNAPVALAPEAKQRILESRQVVDMLVDEAAVVYGITTGFGKFSDVTITQDECRQLQRNLIVTHAVGAGDPFPRDVARGIMLLRVNNLAKGFSGTRLELVETLVAMLNRGVTPVIPQKGSLGASGDLAPLSHMVLPMLGLGQAEYEGEVLPGDVAMERAGIPTVELVAKEGLALINGTQAMTSVGALAVYDAIGLMKAADIAAAMSFEANRGVEDALDPRVHAVRPHDGQMKTAANLRNLLFGSGNVDTAMLATAAITIIPISLATMVEHIGDMCAISSTCGRNYIQDPGLHRTLLGDGLATSLAALFGAPANTTYGENTGVLALSKVYDPRVIRLAAVLAIIFSFCPKFAEIVHAMPTATIGGVSLVLYGMISAVGVRNVVENKVDFTKSRNVIIAALILVLAIGITYSGAGAVKIGAVSFSGLATAAIVGIALNAILPGKDYEFGADIQGDTSVNFKV